MLIGNLRVSLICLVIGVCFPSFTQAASSILLDYDPQVWRIYAGGRIEPIDFKFQPHGSADSGRYLRAAPNGQKIAFVRHNNLWLLDVETHKTTRITSIGRPYSASETCVDVAIVDWGKDNNRILYLVSYGDLRNHEDAGPELLKIPAVKYGYHIWDLSVKKDQHLAPLDKYLYLAWLPDDSFLLTPPDKPFHSDEDFERPLLRYKLKKGGAPEPLLTELGLYSDPDVSADGRWLLITRGQKINKVPSSQILKMDVLKGTTTVVTPLEVSINYTSPKFSPSLKHISYIRSDASVMVDGQPLARFNGPVSYRWIDDQTIAIVTYPPEVIVIDTHTGQEKARHKLK